MTELAELLGPAMSTEVEFTDRDELVPGDLETEWRLSLLLMILDRCHGRNATVEQLHVVGWLTLNTEARIQLAQGRTGGRWPDSVVVRYDPAWARSIDIAVGLGLTDWQDTGRIALTPAGTEVVTALWALDGVFGAEREFLSAERFSQARIARWIEGGS